MPVLRSTRHPLAAVGIGLLVSACGVGGSPTATGSPIQSPTGIPIGELGTVSAEELRAALLGQPPYPSGWEEQVDALVADVAEGLRTVRVPDTDGMEPDDAACAIWQPLVGNTDWATGAFVERQAFIAHLAVLTAVAPGDLRDAADEALAISSAAAAEQLRSGGDPAVASRRPHEAIRSIGLWAVEHCNLPIAADEPPNTEGWTEDEVAQSCAWDRQFLVDGEEAYAAGAGAGSYAEHPHVLEVTLDDFVYPAWHRVVDVDNASDPPTITIEPIPGGFCDR